MKEAKPYFIFLAVILGIMMGIIITAKFNINPATPAEDSNQELRDKQDSASRSPDDVKVAKAVSNTIAWVAQRSIPAVVSITVQRTVRNRIPFDFFGNWSLPEQKVTGMGSGFFVSEDGYIITNYHVVGGADKIVVKLADDRDLEATIVGEAQNLDLAVIKVDGTDYPILKFGDSDEVRVGETCVAIGAPFGYRHTVTSGIISAQAFLSMQETQIEDFIQTDAAVNPGNSGGPLLDIEGRVIGVNTAISSKSGGYDGISFAIPANIASFAYEAIRDHGKIQGGFIGVQIDDVSRTRAEKAELPSVYGCLITGVLENSPADKAGLKKDDIVLEVNGKKVRNSLGFYNMIYFHKPGDIVTLLVRRDNSDQEMKVTVSERTPETDKELANKENGQTIYGASVVEKRNRTRSYVMISEVEEDSVCAKLSLRKGDIILSVNDDNIATITEFEDAMEKAVTKNSFTLKIQRNGVRLMIMLPDGIAQEGEEDNQQEDPGDLW